MKFALFAATLTWLIAAPVHAEVTNQADNGFTIKHMAEIEAAPAEVWKMLIAPAKWWNGEHTFSGDAENLYLVPQAGGCFCELIRNTSEDNIKSADGSVQHMRALFVSKNKALRMSGALGPLQGEAVDGILTIELLPKGQGTAIRFTYKVGGYMELPIDQIAPAVDGVIGEQLRRLGEQFVVAADAEETPAADDGNGNDEL